MRRVVIARGIAAFGAVVAATVLVVSAPAALADGPLPPGLSGEFRGTFDTGTGVRAGDFTVVIEADADRFTVSWPPRSAVTFTPARRPNVFRALGPSNPLHGGIVHWVRIEEGALVVYSMQIDTHGGYDIRDYTYVPIAEGLELTLHRIRSGGDPEVSRARLVRYGN